MLVEYHVEFIFFYFIFSGKPEEKDQELFQMLLRIIVQM